MLLTASAQTTNYILFFVDGLLVIYGLYCIATANRMKQTGVPAEWLVSKEEKKRLRSPEKFSREMSPKTLQFGIFCIVYGAYALFERLVINVKFAQIAGILVFVIGMYSYIRFLQDKRKEYIKL